MDELRIPKRRVPIEITLVDGSTRRVEVFLSEVAETHPGPEQVEDLVNGELRFLPAFDSERKAMTFLNPNAIKLIQTEADAAAVEELATEHVVALSFAGGERITGRVRYVMPPDASRVSDYLAEAPCFLRVEQGEHVLLVNGRHLVSVEVLDDR